MESTVEVQKEAVGIKPVVTTSSILKDLESGYTRTPKDKYYQGEGKSLTEKYNLTTGQVKQLFEHPTLKGKKTKRKIDFPFILKDDTVRDTITA